jgi:hypothetical protein
MGEIARLTAQAAGMTAVLRWNSPLLLVTGALLLLAAATTGGLFIDHRVITGAPIWLKPWKFAVSFALYTITLAWMLSVLPRRSRVIEGAAVVLAVSGAVEVGLIVMQAARDTTSHYNQTTPFNGAVYQAMGISIGVFFAAHLVIAAFAVRQRIPGRADAYAIRLGLGLCVLGMLAAVPMLLRTNTGIKGIAGAHTVGVPDGGPGLPLVGWSSVGGDLRIGHFVGLHALQALPLLGLLLARWFDQDTRARLLLVAGAAYGVLVMLLTWQALRGQPLLRLDVLTAAAFAALAVATVVAVTMVVRRRVPVLARAA